MIHKVELRLLPSEIDDEALWQKRAAKKCKLQTRQVKEFRILRRSIDARKKQVYFRILVAVYQDEVPQEMPLLREQLKKVSDQAEVIIVGAGPAGYFAALELLEKGYKPILFDRGKDVQA